MVRNVFPFCFSLLTTKAMQARTLITDLLQAKAPRSEIRAAGWVRTRRDAKGFSFMEINDGSCLTGMQVIIDDGVVDPDVLKLLTTGAAVDVLGALVESQGKGQKWEVRATSVTLLGEADAETYPLQKKRHSDEFLRSIAHLRPRTNKYGAITRIRSEAAYAVHEFFRQQGFFHVHTPILTGSDCEGAGELFYVSTLSCADIKAHKGDNIHDDDFFGKPAYLTVSGQLAAEAMASAVGKVYTFGPTFRAENSNTPRHAAEFWMIEPEMAFADLNDDMDLAEEFVKTMVGRLTERCSKDLELFAKFVDKELPGTWDMILNKEFARITHAEAVEILRSANWDFEFPVEQGMDLQTEHERYLTEHHFERPVIVYDWPREIKAFYMKLNDDQSTVAAMDVLLPRVGELIGGSAREDRLDVLETRLTEAGLEPEHYSWYLDLRRFGTTPHAGFGLGFERFLMMLTGVTNIRDVIAFPRTPKHLEY